MTMMAVDPATLRTSASNLTGFRSGRLTALVPTRRRVRNGVVWLCACDCGAAQAVQAGELRKRRVRSCGCLMRGQDSHLWNGGRYVDYAGYVVLHEAVFAADELALLEPMCRKNASGTRTVLEHRAVMALHLGRALEPHEQVHHRNSVRDDNRIENLELWAMDHPNGSRVGDLPHCPTCTCCEEVGY